MNLYDAATTTYPPSPPPSTVTVTTPPPSTAVTGAPASVNLAGAALLTLVLLGAVAMRVATRVKRS